MDACLILGLGQETSSWNTSVQCSGALGQLDLSKPASAISPARLQVILAQRWNGRPYDLHRVLTEPIVINSDLLTENNMELIRVNCDHEPGPHVPSSSFSFQSKANHC